MFPILLVTSRTLPRSEERLGKLSSAWLQMLQPTNSMRVIGAKEDDDDTRQSGACGRYLLERHHRSLYTLVNSSLKYLNIYNLSKLTI